MHEITKRFLTTWPDDEMEMIRHYDAGDYFNIIELRVEFPFIDEKLRTDTIGEYLLTILRDRSDEMRIVKVGPEGMATVRFHTQRRGTVAPPIFTFRYEYYPKLQADHPPHCEPAY